jgi:hypothetical protein
MTKLQPGADASTKKTAWPRDQAVSSTKPRRWRKNASYPKLQGPVLLPPMPPLIATPVPPPPPLAEEVSVEVPAPVVVDVATLPVMAPPIAPVVVEPPPLPLPTPAVTLPVAPEAVVATPPPRVMAPAPPDVVPPAVLVPVVVAVPPLPPWACDQLPFMPPPATIEAALAAPA